MSATRSEGKDLTRDDVGEQIYTSGDWEEVTLLHTADTAGDLLIGFTGGKLSKASAFLLPRNLLVQLRVEPGVTMTAMSAQGPRRLNVIISPLPWSERVFARLCETLGRLEALVTKLSGGRR